MSDRPGKPTLPDARTIDALYGLEPVIEPGDHAGLPTQFMTITCPSCGESYAIVIDLTAGSCTQIEDCQVCCQPMQVSSEVNEHGELATLSTRRLDEV